MLNVLIADDHDIVRHGIREIIERHPDWQVCGEAANGRDAVALTEKLAPDIIVMDLAMPELNGLEATRQIHARFPQAEVLVFSMLDTRQTAREALAAGARGYVIKTDAILHLERAIEALARHEPYFTAMASTALLDVLNHTEPSPAEANGSPARDALTPREREIVQLIAEGASNKSVASKLSISVKTVETHRAAVMHKLGFTSVADLVRYAIRHNLISP